MDSKKNDYELPVLILPVKLKNEINSLGLTRIQRNHCYDFFNYLFCLKNRKEDDQYLNPFIDIPSVNLRKVFTKDYSKFLTPLKKNNIILLSPYFNKSVSSLYNGYKPLFNKSYGYKINEILMDCSHLEHVEWNKKERKHKNMQIKDVIKDLNKLKIDIEGMIEVVKNYNIIDFIEVNDEILDETVQVIDLTIPNQGSKPFSYPLKTKIALERAQSKGVDLIKFKNNCYFAPLQRFKQVRTNNFKASQIYAITSLLNKDFYASTNPTNNRLDTNLTNLKSSFIKDGYIKLDGENLTDIDLKNSQPTLLAYLFSNIDQVTKQFSSITGKYEFPPIDNTAPDVIDFILKAGSGQVYDYICTKTCWERSLAKNIFLVTMFSKPRWNSNYKKKLKDIYPTVIGWIDEFKTVNKNYKCLAILLQKIESEIFIKNIYPTVRKEYIVFSKHDSLICRVSEKPAIKKKMEKLLDGYGFKYRLE